MKDRFEVLSPDASEADWRVVDTRTGVVQVSLHPEAWNALLIIDAICDGWNAMERDRCAKLRGRKS